MSEWYTRSWTLMGVGLLSGGLGVGLVVAGASLGWSCMGGCGPWPAAIALGGAAFVLGGVVLFAWGVVRGILVGIRFIAWTKTVKLAATALAVALIAGAAGVAAWSWPEGPHIVASPNGTVTWLRRFDTRFVRDRNIAVGPTGVYVARRGIVTGERFVRKYDYQGNELWTRQFGTSAHDSARGIAVGPTGVYVAGGTAGTLPGQTNAGDSDAFVRKYDHQGNEVWTRQFGTSHFDSARGIAVGPTGVYVTGGPRRNAGYFDAFVRKYDHEGDEVWTRQFGASDDDIPGGIAVGPTGVYVIPEPPFLATLPTSQLVFVHKYDHQGNEVWTRRFGTSEGDIAREIAVGPTGVYVAGDTRGTFPGQANAG